MKKYISYPVISAVFIAVFVYLFQPVWAFGYTGLPVMIFLLLSIITAIEYNLKKSGKIQKTNTVVLALPLVFAVLLIVVILFSTAPMFHAKEYRNLIGEVNLGEDFSKHVAPISTEEIRIVDKSIAYRIGDKVLGTKPSLEVKPSWVIFLFRK